MTINDTLLRELAPTGVLRASINLGNPILANKRPEDSVPFGISVDLATEFAKRLGVELQMIVFDAAGKAADALTAKQVDIGFLAIDPKRGEGIDFAPPYLQIEGSYLVRNNSLIRSNDEVDVPGMRVVVGKGSAYDLYLTRSLKNVEIVRAPTSPAVVETFLAGGHDVAAGVRQQLEADSMRIDGLTLLPGRFMVIHQAVGVPKGCSAEALNYLIEFVEEMKANGFVAAGMQRHGIAGATVAPAGYSNRESRRLKASIHASLAASYRKTDT